MKNFRRLAPQIFFLSALAATGVQAQALRCDLIQTSNSCLDVDSLSRLPQPIIVPSNVTRLENNGLRLCQRASTTGGNADIVYVYDNSGSMAGYAGTTGTGRTNRRAWVGNADSIPGVDTVFYYSDGNCGNTATSGTVIFTRWDPAGTAQVLDTVSRITSNAGCTNFSGDPYNVRGRAYRLGIQTQASLSATSTAGIMSFATTVGNSRRPLALNPANVATLLGPPGTGVINSISGGGTNYRPPLDSSKNWLLNAAITSQAAGRSKAVIFLSDGRPTDTTGTPAAANTTNYLSVLLNNYRSPPLPTGAMPAVYGIFLGRDTVGTGRLRGLSQSTGGQFYLIPPNRPDSLIAVVDRILNLILVQFNPLAMTITNTLIPQTSTATLVQDTVGGLHWNVTLDSVIGLRAGVGNPISVVSSYQRIRDGVPDSIFTYPPVNFTLSTTGAAATGTATTTIPNTGTMFATHCYPLSRIQWLCNQTSGANCTSPGIRPPYFTEADSLIIRLRLRSAASDSDDAAFVANNSTMRPTRDGENASLARTNTFADSTLFALAPVPMRVSAAAAIGNNVLEPYYADSLIGRWMHPRDTRDSARDTIPIRPTNITATTWFSTDSNGAPTSFFPSNTPSTGIWVVVQDNRALPGFAYRDTIWNDSQGTDRIVVTLIPVPGQPGRFTANVPFQVIAVKNTGDAILQISPAGDQLHTSYRDPLYGDYVTNTAGFGVTVQEPPTLRFVTATGTVLADSAVIPFGARVYLRYTDDNVSGGPATKAVQITSNSMRLGGSAALDQETLSLRDSGLVAASTTLRAWRDSFNVSEDLTPTNGNSVLEGGYRLTMVASVTAHNNLGSTTGQPTVLRTLIFAHPDSTPSLTIAESVNPAKVNAFPLGGPVDVLLTLRDQDFVSNAVDTILVTALCPASSDSVAGIRLRQTSPGVYATGDTVLRDNPSGNTADRILGCPAGSPLTIRYVDAVYGTTTSWIITETATPTFAPSSVYPAPYYFFSSVSVAIASATTGATLNYTQNMTLPQPGQPQPYTVPVNLIAPDTLRAVAMGPGGLTVRSRVANSAYLFDPNRPASQIRILDGNGNPIPVSPLTGRRTTTDTATSLRIQVTTPQGGLGTLNADIGSRLGDAESPDLAFIQFTGTTNVFQGNISFRAGTSVSASGGNDTLEARLPDTLIATWRNPINAADVVYDTVIVWPATVVSTVCFAAAAGGPCVPSFTNAAGPTVTTVYVRVTARADLPGTYSARVSTGPGGGADVENFTLTQFAPGSGLYFSAAITMNENTPKTSANGTLQAYELGDTLRALFVHPLYRDSANGSAVYGLPPEIQDSLVFLSPAGTPLPNGSTYYFNGLGTDSVRVRYTADWSTAIASSVNNKTLTLVLDVFRNGVRIARDTESVALNYNAGAGEWRGTYPLRERMPTGLNGTVESAFQGVLTASVQTHTNTGSTAGQPRINQTLNIYSRPNANPTLTFTEHVNTVNPEGPVDILLTLTDQDYVGTVADTATVTAVCPTSPDSLVLRLRETSLNSGVYTVSAAGGDTLFRNDPPANVADRLLSCISGGGISIRYIDPVYGNANQWSITETAMPTPTPPSGTTFFSQQSVTLATTTFGAGINFDTTGVRPAPGVVGVYSTPISLYKSDTIKAVAMGPGGTAAGYVRSRVMTASYLRTPLPSSIVILDSNGNALLPNPLAGGRRAVTDAATSLRIQVTTSQGGLGLNTNTNLTSRLGDVVTHPVDSALYNGQIITFRRNIQLLAGTGVTAAANGIWEARLPDTLIATWTNPSNPADVVRDTIIVLPAYQASTACFTAAQGGPCVSTFTNASSNPLVIDSFLVFIRVDARPNLPGIYTARVTTTDALDTLNGVALTQTAPGSGIYVSAAIGLRATEFPRNTGNGQVEVSNGGDQFEVRFVHPQYQDVSTGVAGYGRPPEVPATLTFLNPAGVAFLNGSTYLLSGAGNDSVRIRYTDDWSAPIAPTVNSKPLTLVLDIRRDGASIDRDSESVVMTYNVAFNAWFGTYPLRELITSTDLNGVVETRFRGELVATVRPHDSLGVLTGTSLTQTLIIARADVTPAFTFAEHVNTLNPEGPVDILDTLRDQSYVGNAVDTALVWAVCPASGDSVQLRLRETGNATGIYTVTPTGGDTLFRSPPANGNGRLLSCPSGGNIVFRYTDRVYGGSAASWTVTETAMPVAAPPGGTNFASQQNVSLSSTTSGAAISYTRIGDVPRLPQPGQPRAYTVPISLIASDSIKAVAMGPGGTGAGYVRSRVMTAGYTRAPLTSQIEILDISGNPIPVDPLAGRRAVTDAATALQIRVTTNQGGLASPTPAAIRSLGLGDDETDSLPWTQFNGQFNFYQGSIPLLGLAGATVPNDGDTTLQTRLPDTVIATWTNPLDPADVVRDTILILPASFPTAVCFALTSGGPCSPQIPNGTDTVFVRVVSRPGLPGIYTAIVTSGPAGGSDTLPSIPLTDMAGSGVYYSGPIVLNENTPKASGNGTVQVYSVGDVLTATFIHPQYQTTTTGTANYEAPAQVDGTLRFLDPAGVEISVNREYYFLPSDSIRVRYVDDWSTGIDALVRNKVLLLELDVMQNGVRIGGDTDTVALTYNPAQNAWLGTYALRDRLPRNGNDTVDTRFRGELTATVQSHTNAGVPAGPLSRDLVIAYRDQTPTIVLANAVGGGPVGRLTTSVSIAVTDQIYTVVPGGNQATVRVSCVGSGDFEDVQLTGDGAGNYTLTPSLAKGEIHVPPLPGDPAVVPNDGILVCRVSDQITAVHTDPVYNVQTPATPQSWNTLTTVTLRYVLPADTSVAILTVSDNTDSVFQAIIQTATIRQTLPDTLVLYFTTTQNERDSVLAIETGAATGVFVASIPFGFALSAPLDNNRRLDPQLNSGAASSSVTATGLVRLATGDLDSSAITMNSQFNPPSGPGYVRDRDGDGAVDAAYLPFSRAITRMPRRLGTLGIGIDSIYWNIDGANPRSASAGQLSLSPDSMTLIIDLTATPFPQFLTGIPAGARQPVAVLPRDSYFGGVRDTLSDSAGAVAQTASKVPSATMVTEPDGNGGLRFKPDTLIITVSEPIQQFSNWYGVFRVSKSACPNPGVYNMDPVAFNNSTPIATTREPIPSGPQNGGFTRFELHTTYGQVGLGDCIYLETDGSRFADISRNGAGRLGIPLGGSDAPPRIGPALGYPPLALPPGSGGFGFIGNNTNVKTNAAGDSIVWFTPACFPPGYQPGDRWTPSDNCPIDSGVERSRGPSIMPPGISAVLVISSSPYTADIHLYDHLGNYVKKWRQRFGFRGELANVNRTYPGDQGVRSFLFWDQYDEKGQLAGQGVYIWKVTFTFTTGKHEVRLIRTGVIRR